MIVSVHFMNDLFINDTKVHLKGYGGKKIVYFNFDIRKVIKYKSTTKFMNNWNDI